MFEWTREVDPAWQRDLDLISGPRNDRLTWLKIYWFAGMPYEPVQRWSIWEITPQLDRVGPDLIEDLKGPSPREDGYWKEDPSIPDALAWKKTPLGVPLRWHSHSTVDLDQWNLFRETGGYPTRFWIIQGDRGGHQYRLSPQEQKFLQMHGYGKDADTPCPGDLPYAEYNELTAHKLKQRDGLRRWSNKMPFDARGLNKTDAGLWVRRDRMNAERGFNKQLLQWLESQIDDAFSDMSRVTLGKIPSNVNTAHGERIEKVDEMALDEAFVNETATTEEI
jgi:hypothetical protein